MNLFRQNRTERGTLLLVSAEEEQQSCICGDICRTWWEHHRRLPINFKMQTDLNLKEMLLTKISTRKKKPWKI